MRILIQRVKKASVTIDNTIKGEIGKGLLIFVGIEDIDNQEDIEWLCNKAINLRIFDDEKGIMNLPITDIDGEILVVSQFTLHASTKKGNRPSYIRASKPDIAIPLYNEFCDNLQKLLNKQVQTGIFGADMQVELINDGPVTIWIDSKNKE
ncbi:D-aminoacyl-tRNA deacylase [Dysgonomonas sp. ZJ709]|uniref:D-aminoacyl-tRNA deacylase n=1 Tax=Dysgonomonas sp. ZJ709 TaxID=2709797 RepID=UPI0013E9B9C7|nr:D-aminoacyl-tRNA deacylase [Dysgonomonas sp. ZJ709]